MAVAMRIGVLPLLDQLFLKVLRALVLLRHPRVAHWYWRMDPKKRIPNPVFPETVNDKFFWRKIFDRNPDFTRVSDKIGVRDWLKEKNIDILAPKILWSGTNPNDIPEELFSNPIAIKASHGSATNVLISSPPRDREKLNKRLRKFLRKKQGKKKLEWGYFDVEPRLMVETMIPGITAEFKLYSFSERVERMVVIYDRFGAMEADVWLPDCKDGWKRQSGRSAVSENVAGRDLPDSAKIALKIASECGRHFDHMRVDLLTDGAEIWFSELTVYNMAGYMPELGGDQEATINKSWDLRQSWFLNNVQKGWKGHYARTLLRALERKDLPGNT